VKASDRSGLLRNLEGRIHMRRPLALVAALFLSSPAHADWYRASSEHFLIYSEQSPDKLRQFAENLEKFDGAVRAVRGMDDLPLSQGNRVTIFRLTDVKDVQCLAGDKSGFIQGFYKGRASGSVAYVSRVNPRTPTVSPTPAPTSAIKVRTPMRGRAPFSSTNMRIT
jgi:hypothetical protein